MGRSCTYLVCALAVGLSACAHRTSEPVTATTRLAPAVPDDDITTRDSFNCANGQRVATQFDSTRSKLALAVDNSLVHLDPVPSASGSKFSNGEVTFWNEGDQASLEIDGVKTECHREISR